MARDRRTPAQRTPAQRIATLLDATGRAKAYRPLPPDARAAALQAGLEAYARGDFFEAHEVLEPAWMGSDDPSERDLCQGLIKLSAAYVHAVRGNARGLEKNLRGARDRLARAEAAGRAAGIDVTAILAAIDVRLAGGPHLEEAWTPIPIARLR